VQISNVSGEKMMSRELKSILSMFAFAFIFIAATSAMAQGDRAQVNQDRGDARGNVATLGCCKCLGGSNALDLSTITSNSWTVTNPGGLTSPVVFVLPIHTAWNLNPGLAKWISTVPSGNNSVPFGPYEYRLRFVVPQCVIEQRVVLTGNDGGDDDVDVYLDSTVPANLLSHCAGGWCFNTSNPPPPFTPRNVGPGGHTLIVKVNNSSLSPHGMFVNAKLTSTCRS
jgi:hypothetical protein